MSDLQWGNLAYLVLLGAVLVFWVFVQNRDSLGKKLQQLAAWGLIFLGVIAVIGLWGDIRQTVRPMQGMISAEGRIEVPRANDGHYYLTLSVNNKPVQFMIDTGASEIVLTDDDAHRVGISTADLAYMGRAMTANGEVRTAPVNLNSVALGPIEDSDVTAWVTQGEMDQSLLGMAYLRRWQKIEITGGTLVLTR
jgi:aspartyl protease family protein